MSLLGVWLDGTTPCLAKSQFAHGLLDRTILTKRCHADFGDDDLKRASRGKLNGIIFPYSSIGIHFVALFLNRLGTKNSMTFAMKSPYL